MTDLADLPLVSSPMPWQIREWSHLTDLLTTGQLPHALLLVGSQHSGKAQLASAFARLLLCAKPDGALNCGNCHACLLSASGGHGDFRWVSPEEKSRVIKVDQIRGVVQFSGQTAGFGLRKVIVLSPADNMNISAYNALLKSLEEPAENTYWILVCHRLQGVPATIRSRCQIMRLARPETDVSLDWLDETTGDRETSRRLLSLTDGKPLLARQLYMEGNSQAFEDRQLALTAFLAGSISVPEVVRLWEEDGLDGFLENMMTSLKRALRTLTLQQLRAREGRACFGLLREVTRLQQAVRAGVNPSKQLLIETTLLKIRRELGDQLHSDTIPSQTGDVRL